MISYTIDFFKQDCSTFIEKLKQEWSFYSRSEQRRALIIICFVAFLGVLALFAVLGVVGYQLFELLPDGFFTSELVSSEEIDLEGLIGALFGLFICVPTSSFLIRSLMRS